MIHINDQIIGYFNNLQKEDLIDRINKCQNLQFSFMNTLKNYELCQYSPISDVGLNLDSYLAFNEDIQVQCEREPLLPNNANQDTWHLVFIGGASMFPTEFLQVDTIVDLTDNCEHARQKILLWGERKQHQNAWYELRIPRALNYPWMEEEGFPDRIAIDILTYSLFGRVDFFRYTGFSEWAKE